MHGVSALVTVVLLGFGAVSIYSLHTYVTTMSDAELGHSLAAFEHSYAKWRADESADVSGPGVDRALTDFTGQATATLIAVVENGRLPTRRSSPTVATRLPPPRPSPRSSQRT